MRKVSRGWVLTIVFISLMSLIFLAPTFAGDNLPSWWSKVFPSKGIRLGLDLKGGIFLLLGVQVNESVEVELNSINEIIKKRFNKKQGTG